MASSTSEISAVAVNDVIAAELQTQGVEVAFGLMSDDTATLILALKAIGIAFVGARHESQAVLMAEGYAFASQRLGLAIIGRGPASTNALTGVIHAAKTGSRVVVILGDAPIVDPAANLPGPDNKIIGGLDAQHIYAAAGVGAFYVPTADAARSMLRAAISYAQPGRCATLHLPTSVQRKQIGTIDEGASDHVPIPPPARGGRPADGAAIDAAVLVLERSRRPLIIAGVGAHRAGAREALEELAERTGAVLATSVKGAGIFRGSPYELGVIGTFSHSAGRRLIDQADCALVVGASLNLYTMSFGASLPQIPIIHVDANRASIGRWTAAQVAVVGDALAVTRQLLGRLPPRPASEKPFHTEETRRLLAEFEHTHDFEDATIARGIDPRALALALDALLPQPRTLVFDTGNFMGNVPYFTPTDPDHLKLTAEFGSIGLGIGTALGVARARPETPTVLVIGDGGLLMTLGELETVVREDLPLVVVVMNDRAYGAERHFLELRGLPFGSSVFPEVDFAAIAAALGFDTATIASLDDLRAVAPMLADPQGGILLNCLINPAVGAPFLAEGAEVERWR
jgi:thiamine pyrophosphate-dependent acetolactate synthase large subunit-like protein